MENNLINKFRVRALAGVVSIVALSACVFAQSATPQTKTNAEGASKQQTAAAGVTTATTDTKTLYEEAEGYVRRKFDGFAKQGLPYSKSLDDKIHQEQRDLALRNVTQMAARGTLEGIDLYYAGRLYALAGKAQASADTLRRFLDEGARDNDNAHAVSTSEDRQNARAVFVQQSLKLNLISEAEKVLTAYMNATPRIANDVNKLQVAFANYYVKANNYDLAATHAREAFNAAQHLVEDKTLDPRQRDEAVFKAGTLVSNLLLKANKRSDALAVVQEMRALAFKFPSARLYGDATETLLNLNEPLGAIPSAFESATKTTLAPEIKITAWVDQPPATLASLRGKVVLLDFWATWCGPCRASMPRINALYKKYQGRGFVVVGLTNYYGHDNEGHELTPAAELAYLRQFRQRNNIAYGFAVADQQENEEHYGIAAIPTAILIDRQGRVRFITISASDAEAKTLAAMVEKLIQEP